MDTQETNTNLTPTWNWNHTVYNHRSSISAAISSLTATMASFPLDSIKSRLQVNKYDSIMDCIKKTYKEEGPKGFYRGIAIPMLTITIVRTMSFTIYNQTKDHLHRHQIFIKPTIDHIALSGLSGGMLSGLLISVGSCAFELVKIRAQLESAIAAKQARPLRDINTWQGAKEIISSHGLRGLYFGFNLHCLRDTIGTGIYFLGYDSTQFLAKNKLLEIEERRKLSGISIDNQDLIFIRSILPFLCGSTCGVMSWFLIYPLDLVKSRLQRDALANIQSYSKRSQSQQQLRPNISFSLKTTRNELNQLIKSSNGNIRILYSGLSISAFRSFFQHGIMWTILEKIKRSIEDSYIINL